MEFHIYRAKCIDVYDGDTITIDIDLGFGIWLRNQKIRLADINTPEIRGKSKKKGLVVKEIVKEKILNKDITIKTTKDTKGKYGRWLAYVYYQDKSYNQPINLNGLLVKEGHATVWTQG